MPELPEVETVTQDLIHAGLVGVGIKEGHVFWERSIAVPKADAFIRSISDRTIENIFRRGKYIVFDLNKKSHLLVHLRMSGRMMIVPSGKAREKHQHVIIRCRNGMDIRLHDPRKFGRVYYVNDVNEIVGRLGPEPLSNSFKWTKLKQILLSRRRMIKPLLLDQHMIAGLGNIYVDEALWEACIHPLTLSYVLSDQQIKTLFKAIRRVLQRGLRNRGTALGKGANNFTPVGLKKGTNQHQLKVFRKQGTPCPRCKETIIRLIVGQRSTHICPLCQPVYADQHPNPLT
jgi:formamidopyrimidine-DNA glycosylase